MPRERALERWTSAIVLTITVFLVSRPFYLVPWYDNDEIDRYPARLEVLFDHMRWDNPWPRWIPELAGGHGYPLFDFFNPMSLLFGLPFRALGLAPHEAMKVAVVILFAIGAIHARLLANRLLGRWLGLLAAVLYVTAPYTLSNFYLRGDLAEAGAMMVFPWVLHHYLAYAETGRRRNWIGIAIGYALLVPMHAFSAMMFTHAFALIWTAHLARDWRRGVRSPMRHVEAGLAAALGILCVSFYWIPVIAEMGTVSIEGFFTMETFDSFALPIYGIWIRNVPGHLGELQLTLGPVLWCFFLVGLWPARKVAARPRAMMIAILVGIVIFASVMSTRASFVFYEILFWLQRIVFPWRWLSLGSLAIAIVGARAALTLTRRAPQLRAPVALALATVALATTWPDMILRRPWAIREDQWAFRERGPNEHILFDYGEYYPETVRLRPAGDPRPFFASPRGCSVTDLVETDRLISYRTSSPTPCTVTVTQFVWIPWHARIDGHPVGFEPDPMGRMELRVPEGDHEVRIVWIPTTAHVLGERLTLISLSVLALLILLSPFRKLRPS